MKQLATSSLIAALALSACSGGTQTAIPQSSSVAPAEATARAVQPASQPPGSVSGKPVRLATGAVRFRITVPARNAGRTAHARKIGKHPNFIPAASASIKITLVTVNGGTPPSGLPTTVGINLTNCSSGCTLSGPNSPPGSDAFAFTIYDQTNENGNAIATGSTTVTVTAGQANVGNVTMQGVPSTFVLVGTMPSGSANTSWATASGIAVNVKDVDGDVITGTYAQPVTVADSDTLSATLASGLTLTGNGGSCSSPSSSVQLTSDTDAANLALCYGGMAISPATISGTTSLVTNPVTIGTFSPTVQPIGYTGALVNGNPEIDLYVANGPSGGTGSYGTWTDSQPGWTNNPYNQAITETDTCSAIAAFAASGVPSGTSWQANAVASPSVGTCTMTLHGGGAATLGVTTTYTTTGVGVNGHRGHASGKAKPPSH